MNLQERQRLEKEALLSRERLKELLHYDPLTGIFTWRKTLRGGRRIKGAVAGVIHQANCKQYICIRINKKHYRAHRLAWLYEKGYWPKIQIDHKNKDPLDNRIDNLREATNGENKSSCSMHFNNKAGYKGVSPQGKKFRAQIKKHGKSIYLGMFDRPEDAHKAYCEAAKELNGEFACYG